MTQKQTRQSALLPPKRRREIEEARRLGLPVMGNRRLARTIQEKKDELEREEHEAKLKAQKQKAEQEAARKKAEEAKKKARLRELRKIKKTSVSFEGQRITLGILQLTQSITWLDALKLVQELNIKHKTNFRLVRPEVADYLLIETRDWHRIKSVWYAPVGAAIAYEEPGKPLDTQIIYAHEDEPRIILQTGSYQGQRDIALFVPNVTALDIQMDGKDIVLDIPVTRLIKIPDFPTGCGNHLPYRKTTIPHGQLLSTEDGSRYLWRKDPSYVGPIIRDFNVGNARARVISAHFPSSMKLGLLIEIPHKEMQTFEQIILSSP